MLVKGQWCAGANDAATEVAIDGMCNESEGTEGRRNIEALGEMNGGAQAIIMY